MTESAFSFTFDWRPDEHARVTSFLIREQFSSRGWRVSKWIVFSVLILSVAVTLVLAATGDVASVVELGPLTLVVSGLVWKFPILTGRLHAWRVRRNDPNVAHAITHSFDDSGLHIEMRTLNAELKWAGMNRVRETPEMFLFYYSRRTAYFLPKRVVGHSDASLEPPGGSVTIANESSKLSDWIRSRLPEDVPYIGL
jgi:hypothetical protein